MVSMLRRMLLRDLWHLRGQVVAASLVVTCGIAALLATRGAYHSLTVAKDDYYASYRFADVFAQLKRAPDSLTREIERISGVAQVRTRVVMDVTLDVPGLLEPATGRLVSIPAEPSPMLNGLHIVRGRYVDPRRSDEALASEAFARANRLNVGDRVGAVLHGRWKELTLVGIALSPEYVYEVGPGMLFPDNRRFGVLWMNRDVLAPAFRMEGAFNDVVLSLSTDAEEAEVVAQLDRLLARYGGLSAYGRAQQPSHRFLTDELGEIGIMTTFIPSLFLGVAAFLLYVVLSRLVAMQRSEIGLIKAFGRTNFSVGTHYLLFALVTAALGLLAGLPLGFSLGRGFVGIYNDYFHFPRLAFTVSPALLLFAAFVSFLAAFVGAFSAVRRAVKLPPAEAMRPEAPSRFRAGFLERLGVIGRLPSSARMILRNVARKPLKAAFSIVGVAFAVGLMVVGRFTLDAASELMDTHFSVLQHDDATVLFSEPRSVSADFELARLPGVLRAESFRLVPVWLRSRHYSKRVAITGLRREGELRKLADADLRFVDVPLRTVDIGNRNALEAEVLSGLRAGQKVIRHPGNELSDGDRVRIRTPKR